MKMNKDIRDLEIKTAKVADIICERMPSRSRTGGRKIPLELRSAFMKMADEVMEQGTLQGVSLVKFVDEYIIASRQQGCKFFLQDEKELIEKWCEYATKFVIWPNKKRGDMSHGR
jgi:hypothetical protein